MLKIADIAFTGTPVTDIKRARAFYEGVLGLQPSHTFEWEGKFWIEYNIGSNQGTLAITDGNPEWKPSASGTTIAFEVEDFAAAIKHLKANQVTFIGEPFETPVCEMALISDPAGNTITIHKCKRGHH